MARTLTSQALSSVASTEAPQTHILHPSKAELFQFSASALSWASATVLKVKGALQSPRTIDLATVVLPATSFTGGEPIPLLERGDLVHSLLKTLDAYATISGNSKSLPHAVTAFFRTLIKIIEYGWLNGTFRVTDWNKAKFEVLAQKLAKGGWVHTLHTEHRLRLHLKSGKPQSRLICDLLRSVGTNSLRGDLKGNLVMRRAKIGRGAAQSTAVKWTLRRSGWRTIGTNTLSTILDAANLYAQTNGIERPFRSARSHATRTLGDTSDRTRSLSVDELALLTRNCFSFISKIAEGIIGTFSDLLDWRRAQEPNLDIPFERWQGALAESPNTRQLEAAIGGKVGLSANKRAPSTNLYAVVTAFHTACFYLLAFMNARRKDEVSHPEIGLQKSSLQMFDDALELATVAFYVEKTYQTRVPLFVSKLTQDLVGYLTRLSDVARHFESEKFFPVALPAAFSDGIFLIPEIRGQHCSGHRTRWYQYLNADTKAWKFTRKVLNARIGSLGAHTMRRAYALLFHYRYENAILAALVQQLGHFFSGTTQTYVTFTRNSKELQREVWGPISAAQRTALSSEVREREKAMQLVGREKLEALVVRVLNADVYVAGNFEKMLRRYIQVIAGSVDYSELDSRGLVQRVADVFEARGHQPEPLPHANCWRGSSTSRHRGRCQSVGAVLADHSKASPELCDSCAYSSATIQHTKNIEFECERLERQLVLMPQATMDRARIEKSVLGMRRVIALRAERAERHKSR